jgi:BirA family biotin operon repressor/biotin-[acetyl-CoA-carboxylase] ligase
LNLQIVDEADSTQDEARRLLEQAFGGGAAEEKADAAAADVKGGGSTGVPKNALIAVISRRQRRGRGTRGRTWESGAEHGEEDGGNLFLTVCLPLESVPVRITLLPLQVAVLVARLVDRYVAAAPSSPERQRRRRRTTVKWPNDVLVDDRKISGTLIESALVQDRGGASPSYSTSWLLIGIGINVNSAPDLAASASPGKHGRLATSLRDAIGAAAPLPSPAELGTELASQLADWVFQADQPDPPHSRESLENRVIEDWKDFAAFGTAYEMRGQTVEEEEAGDYEGERVTAQDIEPDGRLVVLDASGRERRLVADYLF